MATKKATLPDPTLPWPIALAAVALIAQAEGLRLTAYLCPAGVWTLGWGETEGIRPGMRWTKAQADQRFCDSLTECTHRVQTLCSRYVNGRLHPVPTNDNELAALVSLAYNIGLQALAKSTVLKAHQRGDKAAAARAFALWNKATVNKVKQVLPGLVARRAAEAALYLTPVVDHDTPPAPMPQAVSSESSLATSPIAQSGAVTAGAGALTLLSTVKDNASSVADTASAIAPVATQARDAVQAVSGFLGIPTPYLLAAALLVAGVAILVHRYKQRAEGWA